MEQSSNGFSEGLMMDLHPLSTPNNVMTNALNATLITYNGNEYMLLNDMGNGRVETAYLPEGYVPLGTTLFGGIIYIVSYNPITDNCQIGCFPSPERNFTTDELNSENEINFNKENFITEDGLFVFKMIKELADQLVNPGDEYYIYTTSKLSEFYDYIKGIKVNGFESNKVPCIEYYIALNIDGKILRISNIKPYQYTNDNGNSIESIFSYSTKIITSTSDQDIDAYRTAILSPYNIITGNLSGKLCIVGELLTIDNFNVEYVPLKSIDGENKFNLYIIPYWSSIQEYNPVAIKVKIDDNEYIFHKNNGKCEFTSSLLDFNDKTNDDLLTKEDFINENKDFRNTPFIKELDLIKGKTYDISLTPLTVYGELSHLTKSFKIKCDNINSGKIEITNWKYYNIPNSEISNSNIIFGYEFNPIYNIENDQIYYQELNSINLEFYKASEIVNNNSFKEYSDSKTIIPKTKVSSLINEFSLEFRDNSKLSASDIYIVKIIIKTSYKGKEYKTFEYLRILYTSGLFNLDYYQIDDFDNLYISNNLTVENVDSILFDVKNNQKINSCVAETVDILNDKSQFKDYKDSLGNWKTEFYDDTEIIVKDGISKILINGSDPKIKPKCLLIDTVNNVANEQLDGLYFDGIKISKELQIRKFDDSNPIESKWTDEYYNNDKELTYNPENKLLLNNSKRVTFCKKEIYNSENISEYEKALFDELNNNINDENLKLKAYNKKFIIKHPINVNWKDGTGEVTGLLISLLDLYGNEIYIDSEHLYIQDSIPSVGFSSYGNDDKSRSYCTKGSFNINDYKLFYEYNEIADGKGDVHYSIGSFIESGKNYINNFYKDHNFFPLLLLGSLPNYLNSSAWRNLEKNENNKYYLGGIMSVCDWEHAHNYTGWTQTYTDYSYDTGTKGFNGVFVKYYNDGQFRLSGEFFKIVDGNTYLLNYPNYPSGLKITDIIGTKLALIYTLDLSSNRKLNVSCKIPVVDETHESDKISYFIISELKGNVEDTDAIYYDCGNKIIDIQKLNLILSSITNNTINLNNLNLSKNIKSVYNEIRPLRYEYILNDKFDEVNTLNNYYFYKFPNSNEIRIIERNKIKNDLSYYFCGNSITPISSDLINLYVYPTNWSKIGDHFIFTGYRLESVTVNEYIQNNPLKNKYKYASGEGAYLNGYIEDIHEYYLDGMIFKNSNNTF